MLNPSDVSSGGESDQTLKKKNNRGRSDIYTKLSGDWRRVRIDIITKDPGSKNNNNNNKKNLDVASKCQYHLRAQRGIWGVYEREEGDAHERC